MILHLSGRSPVAEVINHGDVEKYGKRVSYVRNNTVDERCQLKFLLRFYDDAHLRIVQRWPCQQIPTSSLQIRHQWLKFLI